MFYASYYSTGTGALADSADLLVHAMIQLVAQHRRLGNLQRVVYVTQDQTRCQAFAIALWDVNEADEGIADGRCEPPSARDRPSTAPTSRPAPPTPGISNSITSTSYYLLVLYYSY